jgi:hypothetical protein
VLLSSAIVGKFFPAFAHCGGIDIGIGDSGFLRDEVVFGMAVNRR